MGRASAVWSPACCRGSTSLDTANRALAENVLCDDPAYRAYIGGYANSAKFFDEHELKKDAWRTDYRLADMLLEKCLTHPKFYATRSGAECERMLHANIGLANEWERE